MRSLSFCSLFLFVGTASCENVAKSSKRDALLELPNRDFIQGFWLSTGSEPEGFLFEGDSVFFADKNEWFHFTRSDSFINIEYYGSNNPLRYRMAGRDTLIFFVNGVSQVNIRSSAE